MKILAVVPYLYDTSPGQRYRIEQWEKLLRARGLQFTFVPFENRDLNARLFASGQHTRKARALMHAMSRRAALPRLAGDFDAVYIYREAALIGGAWIESLLHRAGVPIVYDFDDAIYLPASSEVNRRFAWLKSPRKVAAICRLASHVMVGNSHLAQYALEHNRRVSIVPSTIDLELYDDARFGPQARPNHEVPVIGWSGSTTTIAHLNTLRPVLQRLAQRENFLFRFIGPCDWECPGVQVESVRWKSATEAGDLGALDIGLMPLPDEPWTRGKCAMKALQYMALDIATVAAPVGVNADIIQHGHNGFLAANEDEWLAILSRLLRSSQLRGEVGHAGRQTVEAEFTAAIQTPRVEAIFRAVVDGKN